MVGKGEKSEVASGLQLLASLQPVWATGDTISKGGNECVKSSVTACTCNPRVVAAGRLQFGVTLSDRARLGLQNVFPVPQKKGSAVTTVITVAVRTAGT